MRPFLAGVCLLLLSGCGRPTVPAAPAESGDARHPVAAAVASEIDKPPSRSSAPERVAASEQPLPPAASERPAWLGTRILDPGPDGYAAAQDTPPELVDRRLVTTDVLAPPATDEFEGHIAPVPDEVLARSTWSPDCPVDSDDLRYVTASFWGFDERPHTGELLVHVRAAESLLGVFESLYAQRFPIEEMRIVAAHELDAPPTGDGNNTTAFVCRPARGQTSWSEHAYGLAVDVNPFHNPYRKGEVVLPELATAYTDRGWHRPGMLRAGDGPVEAFAAIGWEWGGAWGSLKDWMHFSERGR